MAEKKDPPNTGLSRHERSERADRPPGRVPAAPAETKKEAPPPPSQLSVEERARQHLTSGGWQAHEADRILSGPSGNSGATLALKRLLRSYAAMGKGGREWFRRLVTEREADFEVSIAALRMVPASDIRDVRDVDYEPKAAEEIFAGYKALAVPERQRMLRWIVDQESQAFSLEDRLPGLLATYRRLVKQERMRFIKIFDEVVNDLPKQNEKHNDKNPPPPPANRLVSEPWRTADVRWVAASESAPLGTAAAASPFLNTAYDLFKVFRRLPVEQRLALIRAAIEGEQEFSIPADLKDIKLGTIDPKDGSWVAPK